MEPGGRARALGAALPGLNVLFPHFIPGSGSEVAGTPSDHRDLDSHDSSQGPVGRPSLPLSSASMMV